MQPAISPPETPVTVTAPVRDWLIDNCRAVLILLVVTGHLVMTYHGDDRVIAFLHYYIYLFHMPAFAFFSGYVVTSPQRSAQRAIETLLPLYIGFSVVHLFARFLFFGVWEWEVFIAPGLLWYLLALMFWRLALPLMDRLRNPILVAFAISLLAGASDRFNTTLTLSRFLVFMPFFLMGYYTPKEWAEKIRRLPAAIAVLALAVIGGFAYLALVTKRLSLNLLVGSHPYSDVARTSVYSDMLGRVVVAFCTVLAIFALMRLLPARQTWFSYVGQYSLSVYVLHMYFIYAYQVWYPNLGTSPLVDVLILLSPIPITLLLASMPAREMVFLIERWSKAALRSLLKPTAQA